MSDGNKQILVVDDDKAIREILIHNLERDGYAIRVCEDGQEAADLLEDDYEPRLAVFDVMMPRLDGHGLLRQIRNGDLPVSDDLPVIMLTSRGREEHMVEGFERGADDYVTKPFKPAELLARIGKALHD